MRQSPQVQGGHGGKQQQGNQIHLVVVVVDHVVIDGLAVKKELIEQFEKEFKEYIRTVEDVISI